MLGALATIGSGIMGMFGVKKQNEVAEQNAERNIQLQKDFAQQGIRWKVADAKAAGIHPLYALGANTTSFAPVTVGATNEMAPLADMSRNLGQDLSRAANATRTAPERVAATKLTALQLDGAQLDNDLKRTQLASSIQRLKQSQNPPLPEAGPIPIPNASKAEERPIIMQGGSRIQTDPGTSPAKAYEDWLGDDILSPGFVPNLWGWAKTTYGPPATWPAQMGARGWQEFVAELQREGANARRFFSRGNQNWKPQTYRARGY